MDPEGNIIPRVEDDMGEGIKDPLEEAPKGLIDALDEYDKRVKAMGKAVENKQKDPPRKRILMQLGMSIHFQGYKYRVAKILKRNRVMLKFMGELPDGVD